MDEFTQRVVGVITATLEIEDQRDTLTSDSPLFGAIPPTRLVHHPRPDRRARGRVQHRVRR